MSDERTYAVWAPEGATWSRWVKPVLFASMEWSAAPPIAPPAWDVPWAPAPEGRIAIVLDLPGPGAVEAALGLAARGYRPVPLYNAVPGPTIGMEMVHVNAIVRALQGGTEALRALSLPPDAPPAFMLDADRRRSEFAPAPGRFDNRSVSFPTDFPSAVFLQSRGISRALLVQREDGPPQDDLAHTLRRWQEGGIGIELQVPGRAGTVKCDVPRPSLFRSLWYRFETLMGLRRNELGGFGSEIPEPSSG
jgi:hypothetical protein